MENAYYRPLPECLTIRESSIHGLGVFATKDIPGHHDFGITHVADDRFQDGYIRLPLGGFFNHSEEPNCRLHHEDDIIRLITMREIEAGEEITAYYTLYQPSNAI